VGEKEPEKPAAKPKAPTAKEKADKRLKYQINADNGEQSLLQNFEVSFAAPLKDYDSSKIVLTDTLYKPITGYKLSLDTSRKILTLSYPWKEGQFFKLLLQKDAATDTLDNFLAKTDTIRFKTKMEVAYGMVTVRIPALDVSKNPVLQWVLNDVVVKSFPLTSTKFTQRLFEPNNYELRILYDDNKNGVWDTGDYWKKKQPERVIAVDTKDKFNVRANWENEFEIKDL